MKRVAVIGGGIGGLTAALLLQRRGLKVTLFERGPRLGGRIAFEEEGPYRIDQGPTIVLLPDMLHGILEEAGIARSRLPLLACDPLYRIHYAGGKVLTKHAGRKEQAAEIEAMFPGEGAGFERFMGDMDRLFLPGRAGFLEQPFQRQRDFWKPGLMSLMARMRAYRSMRAQIGRYFRSEELTDAYSLQSLYIGGTPFGTPGIYSLLPYAEHEYGVWMLKGGYGMLPRLLGEELERRGVSVRLNAEVTSIGIRGGRATDVGTAAGKEAFDAVLYNGDFPSLGPLLEGGGSRNRSRRFTPSTGCVLVYLGVSRRWEGMLTHQFFLPESLHGSLKETFGRHGGRLPGNPAFYVFNPAALDDEAAPPGESVLYFLIPVPPAAAVNWEEEASRLAERVILQAEQRGFPGLREHIRWKKVRTPADALHDGLYGGGSFGIAPLLSQSGVFRPQAKPYPSIAGLYAAGASVHPGGGVPIVMQGAKMAADQLIKEMSV
ncbi:phytoene desaturase family protein [Paenibacillus sp. SAF-054]|uniref:phytoene desaturase family protein n=1 Tax=unclassified Paenibacillus TaxID=185978 RepID=UPI003F803112